MAAIVPVSRVVPTVGEIKSGLGVLATTHGTIGRLLNWCHGRGMVNVPAYCPGNTITAGNSGDYFFRVGPRYQAIERVWCFTVRSTDADADALVTVTVPATGGATGTFVAGRDRETISSYMLIVPRSAQSAANETLSCRIAVSGKGAIVEQIASWDLPRAALDVGGSDGGVDVETLVYRERIYDGTGQSIGGLVDGTIAALAACRRVLFQYALPATTSEAINVTATAYGAVIPATTIVLARKLYQSSTTGTVTAQVYARTADASDIADVRFTTTSGASAVINIPINSNAAFAWHGAPLTFAVDCEDLGTADGLQGGVFDELTVEAKVTAAGDRLYLASASGWEA